MPDDARATTLAEVWNNFMPSQVLAPDSIFRVERDHPRLRRPQRELRRALKRSDHPKWFMVGHRGCGKSTLLRYLVSRDDIIAGYYPVLYELGSVADLRDLRHQELLFSVASQLVEVGEREKAIGGELGTRLASWGRTLVETIARAESAQVEVGVGLSAVFAKFFARLQTQHSTRNEFRRVVEPQLSDLIALTNEVATAIETRVGRRLLVAIDDLDKLRLDVARRLYEDDLTSLHSPRCRVIYTVPVSILHEAAWTGLRGSSWYVPNVKLYAKNDRQRRYRPGFDLMRTFIDKRMDLALLTRDALAQAITLGGGVFRQTCRVVQTAADLAEDDGAERIALAHVRRAAAEIADSLVDPLTAEDFELLVRVAADNDLPLGAEASRLLHNLSLLRYPDENHWHDVNPVLWELVDDDQPDA